MTERRDLCAVPPASWGEHLESIMPLPERIVPWHPGSAAGEWMTRLRFYLPGA
jgi:hypothetical protein